MIAITERKKNLKFGKYNFHSTRTKVTVNVFINLSLRGSTKFDSSDHKLKSFEKQVVKTSFIKVFYFLFLFELIKFLV